MKWILLAISVALLAYFIYKAVAFTRDRNKWERDREWNG